MKKSTLLISVIISGLLINACSNKNNKNNSDANLNDTIKETFSIANLVDEVKTVPDSITEYLHAQHHSYKVLERRTVPAGYETANMKYWKNYVKKVEDLPVINPGPGEYVHVMEGQKKRIPKSSNRHYRDFPGWCASDAYT